MDVVQTFQKLTRFRSVLVFLATKDEIRKSAQALRTGFASRRQDVEVRELYSGIGIDAEKDICRLVRDVGARVVVLSTNVAEASVTLVNLDAVIDFARENARLRSRLKVVVESRASSVQRRGRAGRTGKGFYLVMLTKEEFANLAEYREPAVCRLPLTSLVLTSLNTGQLERCTEASTFLQDLPTHPPLENLTTDLAFSKSEAVLKYF